MAAALERVAAGSEVKIFNDSGKRKRDPVQIRVDVRSRQVLWGSEKHAEAGKLHR
eukprot:SAG22_NODE_15304_length_352_cov_0.612648_1_plen_54_part_01